MKMVPLLRLGFRPFFLMASLFSSLAVLLWLVALGEGGTFVEASRLTAELWHAHEMTFGFVFAVIAGFLLTATKHWTGFIPAQGIPLGLMVLCWLLARFCMYFGYIEPAFGLDTLFGLSFVFAIARVLIKAKMWRNLVILSLIGSYLGLNVWFYIDMILPASSAMIPVRLALGIAMLLVIIISARIIPIFSQNAIQGLKLIDIKAVTVGAIVSAVVGFLSWMFCPPLYAVTLCFIAAVLNLIRWLLWKPWSSWSNPMFWVLLVGYLWVPVSFIDMALNALGLVSVDMPVHSLAIGAIGMPIIGMMARVSRGHTGRPVVADWLEKLIFHLVCLSAVVRIVVAYPPIMESVYKNSLILLSGSLWIVAFVAFAIRYGTWYLRERADGAWG